MVVSPPTRRSKTDRELLRHNRIRKPLLLMAFRHRRCSQPRQRSRSPISLHETSRTRSSSTLFERENYLLSTQVKKPRARKSQIFLRNIPSLHPSQATSRPQLPPAQQSLLPPFVSVRLSMSAGIANSARGFLRREPALNEVSPVAVLLYMAARVLSRPT